MLRIRPIQVLLIPVIACSIIEEHESSATRNAANTSIDVCFYIKKGHPRSCKTFENLTTLGEFMSKPHVKVEIHDQFLTKLHKYSFSRIMYTKELVIANCGVLEIEPGAFHNSLSLLKFDIQRNRLEILREGVFNGLLISHLNLAHNKIRTIDPDALSNMQNIEEVNLLNNLISVYDVKWFNKTPLLKSLCFQNNTIREIPETAFRNLIDMKHGMNLFYSFNMIKTVHPKAFQDIGT
ncbi:leucine-rich repeats and immunoglobulin-like domains protein sma-10 isoform X2 [Euwallacea fornicatus]|uniref:leucine-rich repeats and immunoglobulin-like domains protein sma-10 isoform X2 n=1 Tax=Euwallacea fornicatus TaxID=995702 RepID=UPI00338FF631